MPTSDLPYVQAQQGRERANPVIAVELGEWTDESGMIQEAGVAQDLFEQADERTISRFVAHAGETGKLAVNFLGGDAEIHAPGSFTLKPGDLLTIPTRAPVSIVGDAADIPFTAGVA